MHVTEAVDVVGADETEAVGISETEVIGIVTEA